MGEKLALLQVLLIFSNELQIIPLYWRVCADSQAVVASGTLLFVDKLLFNISIQIKQWLWNPVDPI